MSTRVTSLMKMPTMFRKMTKMRKASRRETTTTTTTTTTTKMMMMMTMKTMEPTKTKTRTRLARRRSLNPRQQYKLSLRLRLEVQFMLLFKETLIHRLRRQSSKSQQLKVFRQRRLFLSKNYRSNLKPKSKLFYKRKPSPRKLVN